MQEPRYSPGRSVELPAGGGLCGLVVLAGCAGVRDQPLLLRLPEPTEFRRPDLVLDVNTPEQYEFMRSLYEYLYPRKPEFHITDIIAWYDGVYRLADA